MGTLGPLMVAGMAIGAGALLVVIGGLRAPIRLADALALLDGTAPEVRETHPERRGPASGCTAPSGCRSPAISNGFCCCREGA